MPQKNESDRDAYVRLSRARLVRAKDTLRLLSQLSSRNNVYSKDEATLLVEELGAAVMDVAMAFGVECVTRVGGGPFKTTPSTLDPSTTFVRQVRALRASEVNELFEAGLREGSNEEVP